MFRFLFFLGLLTTVYSQIVISNEYTIDFRNVTGFKLITNSKTGYFLTYNWLAEFTNKTEMVSVVPLKSTTTQFFSDNLHYHVIHHINTTNLEMTIHNKVNIGATVVVDYFNEINLIPDEKLTDFKSQIKIDKYSYKSPTNYLVLNFWFTDGKYNGKSSNRSVFLREFEVKFNPYLNVDDENRFLIIFDQKHTNNIILPHFDNNLTLNFQVKYNEEYSLFSFYLSLFLAFISLLILIM